MNSGSERPVTNLNHSMLGMLIFCTVCLSMICDERSLFLQGMCFLILTLSALPQRSLASSTCTVVIHLITEFLTLSLTLNTLKSYRNSGLNIRRVDPISRSWTWSVLAGEWSSALRSENLVAAQNRWTLGGSGANRGVPPIQAMINPVEIQFLKSRNVTWPHQPSKS